jgi:hypothetical protein
MVKIRIDNVEHDALFTLRAQKTYKDLTGKDITTLNELDEITVFIFACIDAAYRWKKQPHTLTLDNVYDFVDLPEAVKAISKLMPSVTGE